MKESRAKTVFVCSACGRDSARWFGRCPGCGAWNTLEEEAPRLKGSRRTAARREAARPLGEAGAPAARERMATGMPEFDGLLGGGIVPGSFVLIGGEPGIGKSTLMLQVAARLAAAGVRVLYVSAEESFEQTGMRARRVGASAAELFILCEADVTAIVEEARRLKAAVTVVDSIQIVHHPELPSSPGSANQVRECAGVLMEAAKGGGMSVFIVGHVTKSGDIAGPRMLEHMVDTVLYFEGDQHSNYRMIRAMKNRFGAANELGVFAMTDKGLKGVANPSAIFLSSYRDDVPGSCVLVTQEGSRPLLVEIQALVDDAHGFAPKRLTVGLAQDRLAMLLAVLNRHAGIACFDQDVFLNAVGGVKITEPAADLAVILAMLSSHRNRPLPQKMVAFGEIGLSGEVRPVTRGQERLKEAEKLGFTHAIVPQANLPRHAADFPKLKITGVASLQQAVDACREG